MPRKLLVFDTHPIQYRSPVFRALFKRNPDLKVYFFNPGFDASHWWFHEVGQIPKQTWDLPLEEGYPNETLGTQSLGLRKSFQRLNAIFLSEKPSAVLIYGYYQWEHWIVRILAARYHVPLFFVGETFSDGAKGLRRVVRTAALAWFTKGIARFIAIGEKTRAYYLKKGIGNSRILGAKYCIDTEFFKLSDEALESSRARWRKRFNIPEDAFVVLFVGRLVERKRPVDVIEVHRKLSAHKKVHTVVIGNGLLEKKVEAATRDLSNFHWAGFQNQEQVREAYCGADVLYVPSTYETWGLVVNEAFSCRCPAVVTDTCGVANDLVLEGKTGFVIPVGDVNGAVSKIEMLLADPTHHVGMGNLAQKKVLSEYTPDLFARTIMTGFEEATNG